MSVSIEQIKQLRDSTGISMTACKKALEEANGDLDEAVSLLRKKGAAKAADRAERSTSNGAVVVKSQDGKSVMVELLCETDFVALGDEFIAVADGICDKLLSGEVKPGDKDLPEIKEAVLKLGENVQLGEMVIYESGNIGDYVHTNRKIGVLVSVDGGDDGLSRDIAMHIAATSPDVISPDEVSEELVAKEKDIWTEQLKNEGKPAEIMDKIMMGKEKKFREENALLKQAFVKDNDKSIEDLLKAAGASVKEFIRFSI